MRTIETRSPIPLSAMMIALSCAFLTACGGSSSSSSSSAPGAPTIGAATAGNGSASIAFTAPSSNGGSAITGYTATCTASGSSGTGTGTSSPITVSSLTNGTTYTCSVTATNSVGTSAASGTVSVTPAATVPDAPTIGTATPASGSITIPYTAPTSNGGSAITGYTATCTPAGGTPTTATGTASSTSVTLSSLTNETAYSCSVTAKNAIGTGAASSTISVTPSATVKAPSAPTNVTATLGDGSASVAFTAPGSNGGAAITGYTATCTASGASVSGTGTASPVTVSSLTNGTTYTCSVLASNTVGAGAASSSTSVTPAAGITAKYSSLNTAVGTSTSTAYTALSGSTTSTTSTAGVGCGASGTGSTDTGVVNANNTDNITATVTTSYNYSWTCSGTSRTLTANGIPNHAVGVFPNAGNPNAISTAQGTITGSATLTPTKATAANYNAQPTGYGINGIKFDANTGGACSDSATSAATSGTGAQCTLLGSGTWSLEALVSVTPFDFGADSNLAHVQPGGVYHYHGAPARLFTALGGSINSTTGVANKMVLIGWGVDGYPIYYKYGYTSASDSTSALKALKGNYLPNSSDTTKSTRPTTSVFPLGTFKNDWAYSASNGGDLDECNGRTGVTPEFPNGIYYYVVTDTYPFAPRCIKGNYTSSSNNTPPGPPGS